MAYYNDSPWTLPPWTQDPLWLPYWTFPPITEYPPHPDLVFNREEALRGDLLGARDLFYGPNPYGYDANPYGGFPPPYRYPSHGSPWRSNCHGGWGAV